MVERTLMVTARLGLHARAAARLVRVANSFQSQVLLQRLDDQDTTIASAGLTNALADAKSILSILMLAASCGTRIQARADGIDEEAAMTAIEKLFAAGFGEVEPANT